MYGNVGIVIAFNVETGEPTGPEYNAFLACGKTIRPRWKQAENTRISALITLRYVEVGMMRQNKFVSKIESTETTRVKRAVDVYGQLVNANFEFEREERHLGVIVWENAFAATPFPRDLFAFKDPEITEKLRLQLRAKVFNIFNHPNFSNPLLPSFAVDMTSSVDPLTGRGTGFLPITVTPDVGIGNPFMGGGGPRNIQSALKLIF
jgi:hypothetical protein